MHVMHKEKIVLCRIQKTKTWSEIEEEIYIDENQSSLINAHHQAENASSFNFNNHNSLV